MPLGAFVDDSFSFSDGRHRFVYTRDYTNDKTIPIAVYKTDLGQNIMGGTDLQARLLWYDPTSIPNPPAQDVDWKFNYWYRGRIYRGASLISGVELRIRAPKTVGNSKSLSPDNSLNWALQSMDNVFLRVSIDKLRLIERSGMGNEQLKLKSGLNLSASSAVANSYLGISSSLKFTKTPEMKDSGKQRILKQPKS